MKAAPALQQRLLDLQEADTRSAQITHRLATLPETARVAEVGAELTALVRGRTLSEVARSLSSGGSVEIALAEDASAQLIGFESGGRRTTSLLVDGEYPKIRALFPEQTPIHAVVRTQELIEAVRRVSLVAERNTPVRLAFSEGQLALDAGTGEDAQANEALEARLFGEDITVAFNPVYLSEGLHAVGSEYVRFSFTTPPKPAVLSPQEDPEGEDSPSYRYLLMPVRLPQS